MMKGWIASTLLASFVVAAACGTGDDVVEGGRAQCAYGGALTDCPDAAQTPEGACWRLVDCGALDVEREEPGQFDWGACVDRLEGMIEDRRRPVIACVAASTCDELRTGSFCFDFGAQ